MKCTAWVFLALLVAAVILVGCACTFSQTMTTQTMAMVEPGMIIPVQIETRKCFSQTVQEETQPPVEPEKEPPPGPPEPPEIKEQAL